MKKFTKDISEIIYSEINVLNNKVKGINFLELLKINIIQKLSKVVSEQIFPLKEIINYENEIKENSRNIIISVKSFLQPISISKKNIEEDTLFLSFYESTNFDIYKDEKNFTSIMLYKNTGISLPKDTLINSKYKKNLLLIEITNKEIEEILKI